MKIITPKQDVFPTILRAMNNLHDFVVPTFGPSENKIILGKPYGTIIVDDGVAAAKEYESEDETENEIIKIIREVCVRTNNRVGDGTTGSLIMAHAILNEVANFGKIEGKKIVQELKKGLEEFKIQIAKKVKKIHSQKDLKKVAMVAFDNEPIAEVIAKLLHKIGSDGVVTIEESQIPETTVEMADGFGIDKGYLLPHFVTHPERMEAVLNDPLVLVTDYRLLMGLEVKELMEKCLNAHKRELLVIAEHTESDALATFVTNRMNGAFQPIVIDAPQFGVDKKELLRDIALMTGATIVSESEGIKFADITLDMLGKCKKVVAKVDKTVIIGGKGNKKEIRKVINYLKDKIKTEPQDHLRNYYKARLARLQNGVAILRVGASTENEMKQLKYKVEDAVNATKVAFQDGVVRGAGIALAEIETSSSILNCALKYPHRQLLENTGFTLRDIGTDIVDPVGVLIAGVESAISIVSLLITSKRIIVEKKEEKKDA